jgi:hypothetical protein
MQAREGEMRSAMVKLVQLFRLGSSHCDLDYGLLPYKEMKKWNAQQ